MTVPHENVAMAMAHGYYRIAGKPAAVMVHVTVGTANAINGIINAARDNIPVLLAAGRTPLTETGSIASRNRPIHWGQEAFDQGGMLREYVKWDYELRGGQPVGAVVDRALDIAMSEPRGPVYLTLPREVLTAPSIDARRDTVRPLGALAPEPARAAIEEAAALIAKAEFPLIVTSSSGRVAEAVGALAALAADFALPVVQAEARDMNLPTDHPMHLGHDPGAFLPKADVVIVIDSAVPWMARNHTPRKDAKVIHISADPLETRYPFRELEADLLVTGNSLAAMTMLRATLAEAMKGKKTAIESRRKALAAMREEIDARRRKLIETVKDQTPIHPAWLATCINQVKSEDAIVISELGAPLAMLNLTKPLSYMGGLLSGGLGFGLGAGLGAKLAAPEREVIVTCGDGSYMFGNPVPYHYVGARRRAADADRGRQQPAMAGGAAIDPRRLPRRPRRQGQRDGAHRAQAVARLREGGRDLRRPRREGRGPEATHSGARALARGRARRHAGHAQRADPGAAIAVGAARRVRRHASRTPSAQTLPRKRERGRTEFALELISFTRSPGVAQGTRTGAAQRSGCGGSEPSRFRQKAKPRSKRG